MRPLCVPLVIVLALVVGAAAPSRAAGPLAPRVRVELLSETESVRPGDTFWIALRQRIAPGWHTGNMQAL